MKHKNILKNKKRNENKAIEARSEIFEFLTNLDNYKQFSDLKPLKEIEIQKIRNSLIQQIIALSKRFNLSLTKEIKERYCKKCKSYLIEEKNSSTRIHKSMVIRTCKVCNSKRRIPLK